ncbi:MAG: hypothetical protein KBD78_10970 [Oligoflexales bacterium]|nr:hypothetical protein [Oligoflexales bacterium]
MKEKNINFNRLLRTVALCLLLQVLDSCATPAAYQIPYWTHYTLEKGETLTLEAPLPDFTPIYIIWHSPLGNQQKQLAYRAWDLDKDGSFEMVEEIDESGKIIGRAYDFDFDQKVDHSIVSQIVPGKVVE